MPRVPSGRRARAETRLLGALLRTARGMADLQAIVAALRLAANLARLRQRWRPRRLRRLARHGLVPALAMALLMGPLSAQGPSFPQPFTDEFQVSERGWAANPAVAMSREGDFALAWIDTDDFVTMVSLYNERGGRVAGPLQMDEEKLPYTIQGCRPDIAMDADGDFVVVWSGETTDEPYVEGVFALRYDASDSDNDLGDPLIITTIASGNLRSPGVAMDADGDFAVVWERLERSLSSIEVQRFDAQGNPLPRADEPLVLASGFVATPSIAMDDDGDFVVAWAESGAIFASRYVASSGALLPVNGGAPISRALGESQRSEQPAVAMDADGDFAVVWGEADGLSGGDRVLGRRFDAEGRPAGGLIELADEVQMGSAPRAAMLEGDVLAVVWETEASDGSDAREVRLAFVRPGSDAPDRVVTVNQQANTGELFLPDVATSPAGDLVVSWQIAEQDEELEAIFARLYRSPVTFSASSSTASTTEGSRQPVTFQIARSGVTGGRSAVAYRFRGTARFGDDYTIVGGSAGARGAEGEIIFAPGESLKAIVLQIVDDAISEPQKSIVLELSDPRPAGAATISLPVSIVTLGDDDLAEVRVQQSGGRTVVGAGLGDELSVALRTAPTAPVTVILTPTARELNLGAGWGAPRALVFEPGAQAMEPQVVRIATTGAAAPALAAGALIRLAAVSADPGYGAGARFTVDGRDQTAVAVEFIGDIPPIISVYLPLVHR